MSSFLASWLEVTKLPGFENLLLCFLFSKICISILKVAFLCFEFSYLSAPCPGRLKRRRVQYLRHKDPSSIRLKS